MAARTTQPASSITELNFPRLSPSGVLQAISGSSSPATLVTNWAFSDPTTSPRASERTPRRDRPRALRAEGFLFHASVPRRRGPRPDRGRRAVRGDSSLSSRPVVEQLTARTLMVPTDARGRLNFSWDATGVLIVRQASQRKRDRDALARRTVHPCPQVQGWGDVHDGVIASCCPRLASAAPCSCASGP